MQPIRTASRLSAFKVKHMAKTANINVRIDPETKSNAETEAAMKEARAIINGQIQPKHYSSAQALFKELDAEEDESC